MAHNNPVAKMLQYKRVQLTPKQLATMQEFHKTVAAIQEDTDRGDKYKVYKNYQRKTDKQA